MVKLSNLAVHSKMDILSTILYTALHVIVSITISTKLSNKLKLFVDLM